MKKIHNLMRWGKKYLPILILSLILTIILQYSYSLIPLFVQYALKVLGETVTKEPNLPQFVLNFLNGLIRDTNSQKISIVLYVALMIVTLQSFRSLMRFSDNYIRGRMTENISKDMRISMYDHIQNLSYSYHNNVDTGDLIQRSTSDIETSSQFISNRIPEIIGIIATIFIGAYQVGSINITLMWVSLVIVPITGISSIIYFKYVNKKFIEIEESEAKMTTIIQENLASARVVRAFATEKHEFDKMNVQSKDYANKDKGFMTVMGFFWGSQDGAVMLQYILTLGVGIYLAKSGKVDGADIAACMMLMGMLVFPVRGLGRVISEFGKALVSASRINEILEIPSEFNSNGTKKPEITGNVEFKNVSFKFPDGEESLLSNVSFTVKQGETIAIVGKTGCGKSTICNILTRMLDYNSGSILIDGVELNDIEKKHLRKNVGMVLQDPFLFSKTIYENIAITGVTDENLVYESAKTASIHDDIMKFDLGYKTIVGEKGTTLSGGQKQRVAIARILVEKRPVIIFDDSLSAVDTQTDITIRNALTNRKNKSTMFIITHRTTTAKEADRIIVLEKGKISQIGKHEDLVKEEEGLYAKLWKIQGDLEQEFNEIMNKGVE